MTLADQIRKAAEAFREFNRVWIAGSAWEQWKRSPEAKARRVQ